jgi:hypothetical protein
VPTCPRVPSLQEFGRFTRAQQQGSPIGRAVGTHPEEGDPIPRRQLADKAKGGTVIEPDGAGNAAKEPDGGAHVPRYAQTSARRISQ